MSNEDGGVAEIVKYNKDEQKMYVVCGQLQCVDIVSIGSDGSRRLDKRIEGGELGDTYGFDAGDITSVDVNTERDIMALAEEITESTVTICDFSAFDQIRDTLLEDKVILKKNTAPSADLEPEYIAVSKDSTLAYVSLQENNAVATLDIAQGRFIQIKGNWLQGS